MIRLEKLLKSETSDTLQGIVRRAQDMGDLTVALRSALETEVAPHLLAANLHDDGELVLICTTPAWAARIRFENEALIEAADRAGAKANRCSVKVARDTGGEKVFRP